MFEKEAEEYATRPIFYGTHTWKDEEKAFKDGAEFGYNKGFEFGVKSNEKVNQIVANEWHYVKDELPSESAMLLLARKTINGVQALIGYYRSNQFEIFNEKSCVMQNIDSVYAWKEIVFPELKESK